MKRQNLSTPTYINKLFRKRFSSTREFFTVHWLRILISLISTLYLFKVILFLLNNQQFYYYWDWPGHIDKSLKLAWLPWQTGWDITYWGGYSTLTYPILSHYLLKIFISIFSTNLGIIIFLFAVFLFQLITFYLFAKKFSTSLFQRLVTFTLLVLTSLYFHSRYLGSFSGTLATGGFTANIGMSLLLMVLIPRNVYTKALFLGLLLLTHSLTSIIGLIYFITYSFITINKYKFASLKFKHLILASLLILGIASPWIVPYIDSSFKGSSENIAGMEFIIPAFLLILMIPTVIKKIKPLDITIIILCLMFLVPDSIIYQLKSLGIQGLHVYRYLHILILLVIPHWPSFTNPQLLSFTKSKSIVFIGLTLLIITSTMPKRLYDFNFDEQAINQLEGRIMNVASADLVPDNPHLFEELFTRHNQQLIGTKGLFYESSSRGIQFYELANQIQPESFKNGTLGIYFNNREGKPWQKIDIDHTAQLLGINHLVYVDKPYQDREFGTPIGKVSVRNQKIYDILVETFPESTLTETLTTIPEVNPTLDLGNWWLDTDHTQLFLTEKVPIITEELNLGKPPSKIESISPQSIHVSVDSKLPAPVIIKFTHNKYWTALPQDTNSYTTPPQWVSPGNIFMVAKGNILLTWNPPRYLLLTYLASALSLILCSYKLYQTKK